jgi:hypothetical protein
MHSWKELNKWVKQLPSHVRDDGLNPEEWTRLAEWARQLRLKKDLEGFPVLIRLMQRLDIRKPDLPSNVREKALFTIRLYPAVPIFLFLWLPFVAPVLAAYYLYPAFSRIRMLEVIGGLLLPIIIIVVALPYGVILYETTRTFIQYVSLRYLERRSASFCMLLILLISAALAFLTSILSSSGIWKISCIFCCIPAFFLIGLFVVIASDIYICAGMQLKAWDLLDWMFRVTHEPPSIDRELFKVAFCRHAIAAVEEYTAQFKDSSHRMVCSTCFSRCSWGCDDQKINMRYVGCSICGSPPDDTSFFHDIDEMVARLDRGMRQLYELENHRLILNAGKVIDTINSNQMSDFNQFEICNADKNEVERFVGRVLNDMNKKRRDRHCKARCIIHKNCNLSQPTLNRLKDTFLEVRLMND